MGTSTAGIAHAAIAAHLMGLPMGYVRSGAKDHGRQNRIEGRLEKGQKAVVIEDLISTGGSVIEVVGRPARGGRGGAGDCQHLHLRHEKRTGAACGGGRAERQLTHFDTVARIAGEEGYISPADVQRLLRFRDNPADESWIGA